MNLLIIALDTAIPADVPEAEILVVVPALNSRLRRWLSDEDSARRRAEERAAAIVGRPLVTSRPPSLQATGPEEYGSSGPTAHAERKAGPRSSSTSRRRRIALGPTPCSLSSSASLTCVNCSSRA